MVRDCKPFSHGVAHSGHGLKFSSKVQGVRASRAAKSCPGVCGGVDDVTFQRNPELASRDDTVLVAVNHVEDVVSDRACFQDAAKKAGIARHHHAALARNRTARGTACRRLQLGTANDNSLLAWEWL